MSSNPHHDRACAEGKLGYMDPQTGLFVMTATYLLAKGRCCGSGCRHCPFDATEQRRAGRTNITAKDQ
jgi:hypothetical protein